MPLPSTILYPASGGGGGAGDVVGPGSSTDNAIPKYDGTTGKLLQNSGLLIDNADRLVMTADGTSGKGIYFNTTGFPAIIGTSDHINFGPAGGTFFLTVDNNYGDVWVASTGGINWSSTGASTGALDTGLKRSAAGIVKVTDGSTGLGGLNVKLGSTSAPAIYSSDLDADTGIYFYSPAGAQYAVAFVSNGSQHGYFGGGCFQVNVPIRWEGNNAGIDKYKTGVLTATNGGIENRAFLGGGTAVASAAALPVPTGRVFHVTGTTGITSITSTNIGHGMVITMIFDDVLTVTDGGNMKLAGDFTTSADDTLTLAYDGTNWYEVCRSVN